MKLNKLDNYIIIIAFFSFLCSALFNTGLTKPYWISMVLTMLSSLLFSAITFLIWKKLGVRLLNKWKKIKSED